MLCLIPSSLPSWCLLGRGLNALSPPEAPELSPGTQVGSMEATALGSGAAGPPLTAIFVGPEDEDVHGPYLREPVVWTIKPQDLLTTLLVSERCRPIIPTMVGRQAQCLHSQACHPSPQGGLPAGTQDKWTPTVPSNTNPRGSNSGKCPPSLHHTWPKGGPWSHCLQVHPLPGPSYMGRALSCSHLTPRPTVTQTHRGRGLEVEGDTSWG